MNDFALGIINYFQIQSVLLHFFSLFIYQLKLYCLSIYSSHPSLFCRSTCSECSFFLKKNLIWILIGTRIVRVPIQFKLRREVLDRLAEAGERGVGALPSRRFCFIFSLQRKKIYNNNSNSSPGNCMLQL